MCLHMHKKTEKKKKKKQTPKLYQSSTYGEQGVSIHLYFIDLNRIILINRVQNTQLLLTTYKI